MNIPENQDNTKEQIIDSLVRKLKTDSYAEHLYVDAPKFNESMAREIGKEFRKKGYYARLSWHANDRFSFFYALTVSKQPLKDINARLAWSEQL